MEQKLFEKIRKMVNILLNIFLVFSFTTGIGVGTSNAIAIYQMPRREFLYKSE
jgi:hypothetical protein